MRTLVEFSPLEDPSLSSWRKRYCAGLEKAQALLLEMMAGGAQGVSIDRRGKRVGYALIAPGELLVEYYIEAEAWSFADSIAEDLVRDYKIKAAIVKSFDALMLSSLMQIQKGVEVMGFLARDYSPAPLPADLAPSMQSHLAQAEDLDALMAIRQDVFSDSERFAAAIEAQEVICYRNSEALVGFGMLRTVRPEQESLEINLAVDLPFRRRAYAAYILEDLVARSIQRGMQPIASCPMENQASRILGERIGLRSRDRLLRMVF